MSYRLGVDVGGTFTDLLLLNEESREMVLAKVPSTPGNQAVGIINGLDEITRRAGIEPSAIRFFMHGTTAATNAILEGKVRRTALIVTEGFRDVLTIMRQDRPRLYDFFARRPEPLVPRRLTFEAPERILHTGEVFRALDEREIRGIARRVKRSGVAAVAVCLLHSYANPAHEQRIREILAEECPGLSVSLSCEILPEIKEYERMSTTAINAGVMPIIERYLKGLQQSLHGAGFKRTIHVMQSNGGIIPSAQAETQSACTVLSGPAAGVVGAVALARQAGFPDVITVDMGGTSFDVCLACQGGLRFTRASEIGGHALSIPMIDIHTIGSGGGSIAWVDQGGVLKVGPQSAGADPGPACYGKGGGLPTVADANLVLNRLSPRSFLGGEMSIDPALALEALERHLCGPLGMTALEVAEGIVRVVNANMCKGIRYVSVEKGHDPRDFALFCFGGNGPLHGVALARELGIPTVLVPFAPGVNSAYGLLMADFRRDYVRTCVRRLTELLPSEMAAMYRDMESTARQTMQADTDGGKVVLTRTADLRYHGQGYELDVPVGPGVVTRKELAALQNRFHDLHEKAYGFSKRGDLVEIVNLRLSAVGVMPKPDLRAEPLGPSDCRGALKEFRQVFLEGAFRRTAIYERQCLRPGASLRGPAIIEQKDSTTLLMAGSTARIDAYGNIIITVGAKR